jgi:Homing endonuclease associated repeat/ROS/MUCR transcriptional regulator protein
MKTRSHKSNAREVLPPDTPSDLSVYKNPLEPVEDGYGYFGTIAKDKSGNFIQCHICGNFYEGLSQHIAQNHKMPVAEYRTVFGVARKTRLTGERLYLKQRQLGRLRRAEVEKKPILRAKVDKALAKGREAGQVNRQYYSLERRNKLGICERQSLEKVQALAKKLGHTPSENDFAREYGRKWRTPLYYYFNTWNNAMSAAGLEPNSRKVATKV